ncbi:hypothetical protein HPB51_009355 [Rhipicephalus microplus]|uniref:Peptidase M13 N-terminal domain-containing protein n=1 Tax=Rhipicephalus microplus TaxID=6941 RepID=A0A9J6F0B3_RHIMP|nr:hypothetical protein HPB51_009355 [Rhipicephalus microplus]
MRLFYSCHDVHSRQQEALRPLTLFMRSLSLSEWPYELGERLPRARFLLQRLSVDYALPLVVSLRVEPDPRDAHANLLSVDLAEPLLHAADDALLAAHAAYIRRCLTLMGAQDVAAAAVATDVHDYEFALAEALSPEEYNDTQGWVVAHERRKKAKDKRNAEPATNAGGASMEASRRLKDFLHRRPVPKKPQLPGDDYKGVIRPGGGLDLTRQSLALIRDCVLRVAKAQLDIAGEDTLRINMRQNTMIMSTPSLANAK